MILGKSTGTMTRKQWERQEYEDEFYERWGDYLLNMTKQQLDNLNENMLEDVNASYPETLLWLKSMVLERLFELGVA